MTPPIAMKMDERRKPVAKKPPDPGQSHQLEDDRGQRHGQRGMVGRDQEWQGVQDAAEERAYPP